jgi:solute carrier family 10 (sodium/bile acid cotransporter), member 7
MTFRRLLAQFNIDPYIVAILATVGVASAIPAHGMGATVTDAATNVAIALLFFLHGARLSAEAALAGARHWRLHVVVFLSTFVLFPALGLAALALAPNLLTPALWSGLILLCLLPSTVQSSIAFTSIAGGNVPAALCSASASNLIGTVLTPILASLVLAQHGTTVSLRDIGAIVAQLLLPFVAGQMLRPWIGGWAQRHRSLVGVVDRGSILLIVYAAFSAGMVHHIWGQLDAGSLVTLLLVDASLLAIVLTVTSIVGRVLGFSREDQIPIIFCGSKKSLASGLPMASVLFAGQSVGLIVLPLMLFHQLQLMVCAALARHYASQAKDFSHRGARHIQVAARA